MMVYSPKPGYDWNPLRKFRNVLCPCGSAKKSKVCHGKAETLPIADVNKVKDYLRELSMQGIIKVSLTDIEKVLEEQ